MAGRLIVGIFLVVAGFVMVKKPLLALDLIGRLPFAEKFIGNSYSFYKFIGVILILVGFLVMTNLHGQAINFLLDFIY